MFEYDMCLCESAGCKRYNECLRGNGIKREGIYTTSYLAEICNEENNYAAFVPIEEGKNNG